MSSTKKKLESLAEALDDVPAEPTAGGHDIAGLAAKLRAQVAAADARDREARFQKARAAYAAEVEALERRRIATRPRAEQLVIYEALLQRAPQAAMHFHKYASATDEELAELIRSLRHLLGDDEPDDE